jgi:hypothetical protein
MWLLHSAAWRFHFVGSHSETLVSDFPVLNSSKELCSQVTDKTRKLQDVTLTQARAHVHTHTQILEHVGPKVEGYDYVDMSLLLMA